MVETSVASCGPYNDRRMPQTAAGHYSKYIDKFQAITQKFSADKHKTCSFFLSMIQHIYIVLLTDGCFATVNVGFLGSFSCGGLRHIAVVSCGKVRCAISHWVPVDPPRVHPPHVRPKRG